MALESYLNPGEQIVWQQRKHGNERPLIVISLLVCVALIPVIVGWFLLITWFLEVVPYWFGASHAITNRRVFFVKGLFSRTVEELPLEQVIAIEVRQPFWQRLFGCGTLVLNPVKAGTVEASSLTIYNIHDPHGFRRGILEQREELARQRVGMAMSLVAAAQEGRLAPPPLPTADAKAWYFCRNGSQLGPVPTTELKRLIRAGDLTQQDLVWNDELDTWMPAVQVRGLF